MDIFFKVIKVIINTLMTLMIIVGIVFIVLYFIGIEPFVVKTGSMKPEIQPGSVSFINKNVEYDSIQTGDIIAFKASTGDRVTHRVINITDSGFETKGDANNNSDGISTNRKNYIGKNIFSIPNVGFLVMLIQTTRGKIILVTLIIVVLLLGFVKFDKPKVVPKGKRRFGKSKVIPKGKRRKE